MGAAAGSFGITVFIFEGQSIGSELSVTLGGTVPAATARVVLRSGGQEVDATLADAPAGRPAEPRYFGAYLDRLPLRIAATVTAYATDGRVVGRFVSV